MEIIEKRKLEELCTLYKLEPELRDIFVEGITDEVILENFRKKYLLRDMQIYTIDFIDFSSLYNDKPFLKSNCKLKVVELSLQLAHYFPNELNVTCITDKDFDEYFDRIIENEYLLYTDFPSMEVYLFDESCFSKFFKDVLHGFPISIEVVMANLGNVLKELFLVCLTLYKIVSPVTKLLLVDIQRNINVNKDDGTIEFKPKEYLFKNLNANGLTSKIKEATKLFDSLIINSNKEDRHYINGHCFINMFWIYQRKVKDSFHLSIESFDKILFLCLDYSKLIEYKLFSDIHERYK